MTLLKNERNTWYHYFTNVYHKWQSYDVWLLRHGVQHRIFCHFGPFYAFYPPNNWKNKKQTLGAIIILHMCTINENYMMYGSWYMKHDRQNFLSFWPFFALLPPQQPKKSKFWKTEKITLRYYCFTRLPEMKIIWCMVPEI